MGRYIVGPPLESIVYRTKFTFVFPYYFAADIYLICIYNYTVVKYIGIVVH